MHKEFQDQIEGKIYELSRKLIHPMSVAMFKERLHDYLG